MTESTQSEAGEGRWGEGDWRQTELGLCVRITSELYIAQSFSGLLVGLDWFCEAGSYHVVQAGLERILQIRKAMSC